MVEGDRLAVRAHRRVPVVAGVGRRGVANLTGVRVAAEPNRVMTVRPARAKVVQVRLIDRGREAP